jgi:hypothetical protein
MWMKRERTTRALAWVFIAAVVGVSILACSASPQWRYEEKLANTGEPALHAVHSDRLVELMAELDRIMSYPEWKETTRTLRHARDIRQMAEAAAALADTSTAIRRSAEELGLDGAGKRTFMSLTDKLHEQSLALQKEAEAKNADRIRGSLDGIVRTCNACHSLFRDGG